MKIYNSCLGFALGEGSGDFGSKMMKIDKIEIMKIKYNSEKKKKLLQLMFIKEEDIDHSFVHKTLAVLDIVYLDARYLREKTNHLNSSFDMFEFNEAQVSGTLSSFNNNKNLLSSNSVSFCFKNSSFNNKDFHNNNSLVLVKFYYNLKCLLSYRIPVTEISNGLGFVLTGMKSYSHKIDFSNFGNMI